MLRFRVVRNYPEGSCKLVMSELDSYKKIRLVFYVELGLFRFL